MEKSFNHKKTLLEYLLYALSILTKKLLKRILYIKKEQNPDLFFLELATYIVFVLLAFSFIGEAPSNQNRYGAIDDIAFIARVNLVFHEAGHILFRPFGMFLTVLGGSLLQSLIPVICLFHFALRKANFSASIMLWWLGHTFMDTAVYIYDAYDQVLPLLGGGTGKEIGGHDWRWILSRLGILDKYSKTALSVNNLGRLCLILSMIWSACVLYKKFILLKAKGFSRVPQDPDFLEL